MWSDAARAAALEVRRRNKQVTVYHGTTQEAARRIMKEGFRPRMNRRRYAGKLSKEWYAGSPQVSTYVTPQKNWARVFAERYSKKDGGAILKLRVPERKMQGEGGGFYYIKGGVVAKGRIQRVEFIKGKHGWNP